MNMASDREQAIRDLTNVEDGDQDLQQKIGEANSLRVELIKEQNRHKETMANGQRGWFGNILGDERHAPAVVAFLTLVGFSFIGAGCLIASANSSGTTDFWGEQARNAFTVASGALGFIFGRGGSGGSKG